MTIKEFEKTNELILGHSLSTNIRKQIVSAISDFDMLEEGDKVMVACSGGKDSSILLALLREIQKKAPFKFEIGAVLLDQKQPGFSVTDFSSWVDSLGFKLTVLEKDTYSIVTDKIEEGKTYCSLCSRLRRGILYTHAKENNFTKIALGHHKNDLVETLFLNMLYGGKISSMPPKLLSDDGGNILIRPMSYVAEADLIQLSQMWDFPVIPCNLCGSQEGLKRNEIKNLINDLEKKNPHIQNSLLSSLSNVNPSHLLDRKLYDFTF
ncbi:tRNA 2-thiocytidine(32) synthetase TtcA [bacterium]|nr:tRNA 2-thiocytidine(32) synthetase TtcA [bacterium]